MARLITILFLLLTTLLCAQERRIDFSNGDKISLEESKTATSLSITLINKKETPVIFGFRNSGATVTYSVIDSEGQSRGTIYNTFTVLEPLRSLLTERHPEAAVDIYTMFTIFY
jgi:hypothetical protein